MPLYADETPNVYAEWEGVDWVNGTRSFQPTPQWQLRRPWHLFWPVSGEHVPPQSDLHIYQAPVIYRAVQDHVRAGAETRAHSEHWTYAGQFQTASAPVVPSSGAQLAGIGVG